VVDFVSRIPAFPETCDDDGIDFSPSRRSTGSRCRCGTRAANSSPGDARRRRRSEDVTANIRTLEDVPKN